MRVSRPVLVLLVFVSFASSLAAQQAPPTPPFAPVRDAKAIATLQAAIAAFGNSATSASLEVTAQQQSPDINGNQVAGTVTWEMAGSEFRIASSVGGSSGVLVTGHGSPAATVNGNARSVPGWITRAMFIPAFAGATLSREIQDPTYSVQYIGPQLVNGVECNTVRTVATSGPNAPLTAQTWYFSNTTSLPIQVVYRSPAMATPLLSLSERVELSNFTVVSGGLYPFQIVIHYAGSQTAVVTLQSVNPNAVIPSTDFDSAAEGAQ